MMIFPTKHMPIKRSIFVLGAKIIEQIVKRKTVSQLWETMNSKGGENFSYDWFIMSLVWLYIIDAIEYEDGHIQKVVH